MAQQNGTYYYQPQPQSQQPQPVPLMQYQPTVQQQNQQQPNSITLLKVPSLDYVKSFPITPGSSGQFMHESEPYMFIKTAPSSPFEAPTITIFKIVKVENMDEVPSVNPESDYVTRKEYDELKQTIRNLEERISNNEPVYRKPNKKWSDSSKPPAKRKSHEPNG